jgi:hypothetical protein
MQATRSYGIFGFLSISSFWMNPHMKLQVFMEFAFAHKVATFVELSTCLLLVSKYVSLG